jgi:hypothetical protein
MGAMKELIARLDNPKQGDEIEVPIPAHKVPCFWDAESQRWVTVLPPPLIESYSSEQVRRYLECALLPEAKEPT